MKSCSIPNCGNPAKVRGWCPAHYGRWRRHGDPIAVVRKKTMAFFEDVALTYDGDECLTWPFGTVNGYGQIRVDNRNRLVSRLVCEHVHGAPPTPKHEAAHSCGKGHEGCVAKRHLSWKTRKENQADRVAHGTAPRGEQCGRSKLTEKQVHEVRALRAGGAKLADIAERYGVHLESVYRISHRRSWKWLPDKGVQP